MIQYPVQGLKRQSLSKASCILLFYYTYHKDLPGLPRHPPNPLRSKHRTGYSKEVYLKNVGTESEERMLSQAYFEC